MDDCGNVINPLLVAGQVHGGIAQGLGQALYEHAVYDEDGQLITGELMDYAIPRARMMPMDRMQSHDHAVAGESIGREGRRRSRTIGCSPALVNSVVDALSPLGVKHVDMPMTPQRIWNLMQTGGRA